MLSILCDNESARPFLLYVWVALFLILLMSHGLSELAFTPLSECVSVEEWATWRRKPVCCCQGSVASISFYWKFVIGNFFS